MHTKTTTLSLLLSLLALLTFGCGSVKETTSTSVPAAPATTRPTAVKATPIPPPGGVGERRESLGVGVTLLAVTRMSELYGKKADTFMAGESDFVVLDLLFDNATGQKAMACAGRLMNEAGKTFGTGIVSLHPQYRGDTPLYAGDVYRAYATYSIPVDTQGQLTWECFVGTAAPLRFNFSVSGGDSGLKPRTPALSGEGKAFQVAGIQIGVTGATHDPHKQRPGGQWLTVEVTLANVSDLSEKGYRPGEFYLTDAKGFRYPRNPLISNQLQPRPLLPNDSLRGNLVFDVDEAAAGLVLNYADNAGNVVRIGL
jgi:hypothetical protein